LKLEQFDSVIRLLPGIKRPERKFSLTEKLKWTVAIMAVYFTLFSIPAFGVSISSLSSPSLQLITIIFAARLGTLITVGISPIVVAGIIFSFLSGADIIKIDQNNPHDRSRMQGLQKLTAIIIAAAEAYIFTATGQLTLISTSVFWLVVFQLFLGALCIIYLDEMMSKYGITSGINMFIAGNVAFSIIAGTLNILLVEAIGAIQQGGAAAIPNAIQFFAPLFFAALVLVASIYAYETNLEIPLVFSQFRGVGGGLPIPLLYVSVLPVVLATALELNLILLFGMFAHSTSPIINFIASYQTAGGRPNLVGGLLYMIAPTFPLPYASQYGGIGGYLQYFTFLSTHTFPLVMPIGTTVLQVPEWIHIVFYTLTLVALCVVFGRFWTQMAGQGPKDLASQLQSVGWQIPGFRRDPRTIESVLNRYIPPIITVGSIFVGFLAAFATLTGAIGSGIGILLTVGIIYMTYRQLEQENLLDKNSPIGKIIG
jgi:preprotein translocase subunit SecY